MNTSVRPLLVALVVAVSTVSMGLAVLPPASAGTVRAATPAATGSDPNSAPGTYRAVAATRVLDTRYGIGATKRAVAAHATLTLSVAGHAGVPASGASAVVLNLTETQATRSGYLTAYPSGSTRPTASNVSFPAGQTVANLATVQLGPTGAVVIYNGTSGTVQVIADVRGYYLSGPAVDPGAFTPLPPTRLLDTRAGNGAPAAAVPGRAVLAVQLSGRGGIPATGVSTVVLNLTATQERGGGYLTVYGDATRPTTSNLNFVAGRTVANLVTVPLTSTGSINIYVGSSGPVQLIADVAGYVLGGGSPSVSGAVVPVTPTRLLDTRCGVPGGTCHVLNPGKFVSNWPTVQVLGQDGIPSSGVAEVVLNVTATQANVPGYLTVVAGESNPSPIPTTSDVNFTTGHTAANQVIAPLDPSGYMQVYFGASTEGNVAAILDVVGYVRAPRLTWTAPTAIDPPHGPSALLSCPTTGFCAGVDLNGNVRTFDGTSWSSPASIPGISPRALSCASPTFCVAVSGLVGGSLWTRYNGSTWSTPAKLGSPTSFVVGVSCPTMSFCMAEDASGGTYTYSAGVWSSRTAVDTTTAFGLLTGTLSCTSTTRCALVDEEGSFFTYDGVTWTAGPVAPILAGHLTCAGPTFCAMWQLNRQLATFDGTSWTLLTELTAGYFTSLACPAANRCVAGDEQGDVALWDGSGWSALTRAITPVVSLTGFRSLSCPTTMYCMGIDLSGRSFTYDGTSWSTPQYTQPTNLITSVSCGSSTFCVATDADGEAVTFDGSSWSLPSLVFPDHTATHVSCGSSNFCVVVDESGNAAIFSGGHWAAPTVADPGQALTAVSCAAAGQCLAVDRAGGAATFDGSWSGPAPTGLIAPVALTCPSAGWCLTQDNAGHTAILSGASWQSAPATDAGPRSVSCWAPQACLTVGGANTATLDTTGWRDDTPPDSPATTTASCLSPSYCVTAMPSSVWFHSQAGWISQTNPLNNGLFQITLTSCPTDRFCALVGDDGRAITGVA